MFHLVLCTKNFSLIPEVFFFISFCPCYFCDSRFDSKLYFLHGEKVIKKNLGERKCMVQYIIATKKIDICINEFIFSRRF